MKSPPRNPTGPSGRREWGCAATIRRALLGLLILSLWHAPVPWVHAHDLRGPTVEHVEHLQRHVGTFHASEVAAGESRLELHTHLVLPWEREGCPCHPGAPHAPGSDDLDFQLLTPDAGGSATGKSLGTVGHFVSTLLATPQFGDPLKELSASETMIGAVSRGSHFFATYGSSVSIGDLVSVRLC